ncbi:hypothetical protein I6G82_12655 [Lysinibacillus macroides]|uniref:Uncharacterized protein n=1 Tax=Lysinibacillus macroides TaxID=33935 RepID=A0A0M9DLF1_9BACI|nr:hypothetical protein [Lysinibacillus macroides]KOY82800.1 hypothetical protein ADM90_05605 [Lysinibacillus macroides]QPR66152.1 hypothetical protein I6G82_12655 [Lysinibacillus macroides]
MHIRFNPIGNLGAVSTFQVQQSQKTFTVEAEETDPKQAEIETSRKKYAEMIQSCNAIDQGATPKQLVNTQTNAICIEYGVYYHLGTINGKPLNGTALTGGGFNSNFSPMIWKSEPGTRVTPEQEAALRRHKSYSQAERQGANELVHVLMTLKRLGDGGSLATINKDAMFMQNFSRFAKGVGLDISKPFTINGKLFSYSKGSLQAVE